MQSVILIGGSGFLGKHLLNELVKSNYKVYATVNKTYIKGPGKLNIIRGGINALNSDILKEIAPTKIFHCARPTLPRLRKTGRVISGYMAYFNNSRLLKNIEDSGIQTDLLFASGSLAYGNSTKPHYETSPINPISYSKQYIRGEKPLLKAISSSGVNVKVLRFPWLIGNGSWFKWFYLKNIIENNSIPLFGNGNNNMSILSVIDAARLMALYSDNSVGSGIYNIFNPNSTYQKIFIKKVKGEFKCDITDYKNIYPRLDTATKEAFFSNIAVDTGMKKILSRYNFITLDQSLGDIGKQVIA